MPQEHLKFNSAFRVQVQAWGGLIGLQLVCLSPSILIEAPATAHLLSQLAHPVSPAHVHPSRLKRQEVEEILWAFPGPRPQVSPHDSRVYT